MKTPTPTPAKMPFSIPAFVSTKRMPKRFSLTYKLRQRRVLRFIARFQPTRSQAGRLARVEKLLGEAFGTAVPLAP